MALPVGDVEELRRIAPDLAPSIAKLTVPAYILDRNGVVRWLNQPAVDHFGDLRGKRISHIVEPAYAAQARREFAALARGHSTERISEALGIAPETVRNHIRGILASLGVHTRLEAVIRGHELGLV